MMLLYISAGFPSARGGIADNSGQLFGHFFKILGKKNIFLLSSNKKEIKDYLDNIFQSLNFQLMDDWKYSKKNKNILKNILLKYQIDAIHVEIPDSAYGAGFLPVFLSHFVKKFNKKHCTNIQIFVRLHEFSKVKFLRRLSIMPLLLSCSKVFVMAYSEQEKIKRFVKSEKIYSVFLGSSFDFISRKNNKNIPFTVGYFGFVYKNKGIDKMLELWKKISDQLPNVSFLIVGELNPNAETFGPYHKKTMMKICQLGLTDKIHITGYLPKEDIEDALKKIDIATFCYEDGLTLRRSSFVASLSMGIPVVSLGGDKQTNIMFSDCPGVHIGNSLEDCESFIEHVYNMENFEYAKICESNYKISKQFDWENISLDLLKQYNCFNFNDENL